MGVVHGIPSKPVEWPLYTATLAGCPANRALAPSSVSVGLRSPYWCARALFRWQTDGFVPQTLHVNLRVIGRSDCGRARRHPPLHLKILFASLELFHHRVSCRALETMRESNA